MSDGAAVCLENLTKRFDEGQRVRTVLDGVNARFEPGDFISILGKSGSGKSTLLNLIAGLDRADGGAIWLNDENVLAFDDLRRTLFRRRHIGIIFQFFNLIPMLTVWENVLLPLELNGVTRPGIERAETLLETVGLGDRRDTFPDCLSGGEQQRVAIARALVHDPWLVLADEPTGNLDEETGRSTLSLLDRLTRGSGRNLILVTHNLEAAASADRVLQLSHGTLIEAVS